MTKEEILQKVYDEHKSITNVMDNEEWEAVCLKAMSKYSNQDNKELREENESLFKSMLKKDDLMDSLTKQLDEKDEQLKYCHSRMADAYKEIKRLKKITQANEVATEFVEFIKTIIKHETNQLITQIEELDKEKEELINNYNEQLKKHTNEFNQFVEENNNQGFMILDLQSELTILRDELNKLYNEPCDVCKSYPIKSNKQNIKQEEYCVCDKGWAMELIGKKCNDCNKDIKEPF